MALDSGQLLTLLLLGAALLLWPLYRRVIPGLGGAFLLFGLLLMAVALTGGGQAPLSGPRCLVQLLCGVGLVDGDPVGGELGWGLSVVG